MERVEYIISKTGMLSLVKRQLLSFFPSLTIEEEQQLKLCVERAIEVSVKNFSNSENKYFSRIVDGEPLMSTKTFD